MPDFAAFLNEFAALGRAFVPLVYWAALLIGFFFAGSALHKIAKMGHDHHGGQQPTWAGVGGNLLVTIGATMLSAWVESLSRDYGGIGEGVASQMAYIRDGTSGSLKPLWDAIYAWIFLLGVCAIFRAFLLFNRAAQGHAQEGDGFWRGFWHILGGAILVNIATH
ncbi:hypothetical protein [Variovorax sp. RA8]|uniref:hypothetical protein n=1 Tax=Variovorax sp. (strain JCM 16519 / RA8) TaxID=662548 RepID=UPI001318386A|nr:hypothetical protein [Variovorax sp. RA8]VTU44969.1 hypothetical protein RA8P2_00405 [Variovorax sp. RA8]